jgi:hypothetical protein
MQTLGVSDLGFEHQMNSDKGQYDILRRLTEFRLGSI